MANGKRATEGSEVSKEGIGESSAKRSRVSRACDQCRASREKCVRADSGDTCRTCSSQNRSCSYNEQPKKRGIQPNYIRTLELTLAWLLQSFPDSESHLARCLADENHDVHKLLSGKAHEPSEALHALWRCCLVCKQVDQLLCGDPIQQDGQRFSQRAISPANGLDDGVTHQWLNKSGIATRGSLVFGAEADTEGNGGAPMSALPAPLIAGQDEQRESLRLPPNALMLLEYYFAFTHCWLPMTEKHSLLKLIYSYPALGFLREQVTSAEHAELWSILALAATQLADQVPREEAHQLRATAQYLIPSSADNISYQMPHLRAMLILALIDIGEGRILAAWLRVGTVVSLLLLFRVLQNLGMTEKWCRHIHLCAFVLESALASHLHVATHLSISYIEGIGSIDEDGLDEWAPWNDPIDVAHRDNQIRSPAKSFSTLNKLVQISIKSSSSDSLSEDSNLTDSGTISSLVFSLLSNASLNNHRLPPSIVISTYATRFTEPAAASRHSLDAFASPTAGPAIYGQLENRATQEQDQYDSGLAEESRPGIDNSPDDFISNLPATAVPTWPSSAPQLPFSEMSDEVRFAADADIFKEFDALLERQDSSQNSQFYQNLGFAPDVALAEFFGADYQPSDPLLAYLNPARYGTRQNGDNSIMEG